MFIFTFAFLYAKIIKKEVLQMSNMNSCDFCSHYVYDEETHTDYCEVNIDEDEMARSYTYSNYTCPYFHYDNEYETVHKQI